MKTFERVAEILSKNRGIELSSIKEDTTFGELKLDSLDVVDLIMILEDEFGVSIEMNEGLKTVGNVAEYLDANL